MNQLLSLLGIGLLSGMIAMIFSIFIFIFKLICQFKIFDKADQSAWKALIPLYNTATLAKISDLSPYLGFFMSLLYVCTNFIQLPPLLELIIYFSYIIFSIVLNIKLSKSFDLSIGFAIGMTIFPTLFYAILAFGPFEYIGVYSKKYRSNNVFSLNGNNVTDYEPKSDFFKD